jgi:hypothetical protein
MSKLEAYDPKPKNLSLHQIMIDHEKTFLDGSFQRYGGVLFGSGWTRKQSMSYVGALLSDKTCNFIVRVDVVECLKFAKEQRCERSEAYFTKAKAKHWRFISVDGYNTSSTVFHYLKNRFGAIDPDNKTQVTLFNDNDKGRKDDIRYVEKIEVITLRRILYNDMCKLFIHLNTGTSLNAQEKRQAVPSDLSRFVRDVSNDSATKRGNAFFRNCGFSATDLDQRSHEELVARICLKVENKFTGWLSRNALDELYADTFTLQSATERRVEAIMKTAVKMAKAVTATSSFTYSLKLTKGKMLTFFDYLDLLEERSLYVKDASEAMKWFFERDAAFQVDGELVPKVNEAEESYDYWISYATNYNGYNNLRYLFDLQLELEESDLIKEGVLGKRRSAATFSKKVQPKLWILQNARDRKGAKISIIDIYLGKYDTDHMISAADGGETTVDNAELMDPHDNRVEKGAKSNQAAFPFQEGFLPEEVNESVA